MPEAALAVVAAAGSLRVSVSHGGPEILRGDDEVQVCEHTPEVEAYR